jgi:putative membrane protein (TIGR04086 family)
MIQRNRTVQKRKSFSLAAVIKGVLISLGFSLLLAFLLSLIITAFNGNELHGYLQFFHYISIALGGIIAARSAKTLGWAHGALVGILYAVVVTGLFVEGFTLSTLIKPNTLIKSATYGLTGLLTGAVGLNVKM